jgi:hypothetical protein
MRAEFRSSKSKNYWKNPKSCGLFEHEYEVEVSDAEWKEAASNVEICLRNFYASDIYDGLRSHAKEGWLEVEEFSSFLLDHTQINLVIDCAIKEGEGIYIYDWKTGKSLSEDLSIQLGCYALYAMEKWNVSPKSLSIIEYNLSFDRSSWFSVSQEEMKGMKSYINGSVKDMQSLLTDVSNNLPMEEDRFSKIEDEHVTSRCNFRRICRR